MITCSHIVYYCFQTAVLSRSHRDQMTLKAQMIYCLVFFKKFILLNYS